MIIQSNMEPSNHQHVRASLKDAVFTNLTVGMGESYFVAFMLALGLSDVTAGAGRILPMFIGVCVQMLAIRGPFRKMSLKSRMVGFILIQALTLPLLASLGIFHFTNAYLVIFLIGLYWAAGLSSQPPWHRLMGETIPARFRLKFFALRNAWAQIAILLGLILAGFILSRFEDHLLETYAALFIICGFLKILSARELYRHKNAPIIGGTEERIRFRDFLQSLKGTPQGHLVGFLFFWYIAVQFSGVYFDPFMLKKLNWGFVDYTIIIAISFVGRILTFRYLRTRAQPKQIPWIFFIGCAGICLTPLWWVVSQNFIWIMLIEILSGAYWAAFELAVIMLYFERIKDSERTSLLTYISFTNTLGMAIGVCLGGWALQNWTITNDPYLGIFVTSTLIRLAVLTTIPSIKVRDAWPVMVEQARGFLASEPFDVMTRPWIIWKKKKKKKD